MEVVNRIGIDGCIELACLESTRETIKIFSIYLCHKLCSELIKLIYEILLRFNVLSKEESDHIIVVNELYEHMRQYKRKDIPYYMLEKLYVFYRYMSNIK